MRWHWLIIAPLIVLIISIAWVWDTPAERFTETLPAVITVTEPGQIGVHSTKEPQKMFNFGSTFPGTKVQKTMNLSRGNEQPAKVHIIVSGEIQNWTSVNINDFVLDEPVQVEVTIAIPDDAAKGMYSGNVTVDYIITYGMSTIEAMRQFLK